MRKAFGKHGLITLFACLIFSTVHSSAQDLGSSSGIFRSPNAATKSNSTSRPKAKTSAPVRKPTPKTSAKTGNSRPRPSTTNRSKSRESVSNSTTPAVVATNPQPQSSLVITVGDKTSGDFDELFEQAVDEGNTARDERNYPRAEAAYRRAQNLKSKDSRAVYGLGNIYADQQRWEEAERAYRQAILLEPDEAGAYIALSYVLTQPVLAANLSDRYAEAEKTARQAIELDANNAFAFDQLGVALELRGIISLETQNAYRRAIQIEPQFALAFAHLGRILRRNGKQAESVEAYRQAMQYSSDVPTMILVADVLQSEQRYFESEQLLRRALALDAKNPTALNMLGRALAIRSQFEEAEKVLRKAADVSPNSFVAYTLLGSLSLRRARLDDAEKWLNKALAVVSQNEKRRLAQDFEAVGDAFMKAGKRADAQRLYRQAVALDNSKTILTEKLAKVQ